MLGKIVAEGGTSELTSWGGKLSGVGNVPDFDGGDSFNVVALDVVSAPGGPKVTFDDVARESLETIVFLVLIEAMKIKINENIFEIW